MIRNIWNMIEFQCGNHKKPIPFYVYEWSNSPFYACPKYMLKDENHPDGHEEDEPGCSNRLSFDMARHFVEKISDILQEDIDNGVISDLGGLKMSYRGIDAKVVYHGNSKIVISIVNKNEIGHWQQ